VAGLLTIGLLAASVGGAYVLADRAAFPTVTEISLADPLDNLESAKVHLIFGAGDLWVDALPPGSAELARGELRTPGREAAAVLERRNGQGQLTISSGAAGGLGWLGGGGAKWGLALYRDVPLALDVDGGAANVRITVPQAGETEVVVNAGAARITVVVPEGVAARISRSTALVSMDVDTDRFLRNGDAYQSPSYDTARDRVNLDFRVGAASVTVR
jgi:hypothetical protein